MRRLSDIYENREAVENEMSRILEQTQQYSDEDLRELRDLIQNHLDLPGDKHITTEYAILSMVNDHYTADRIQERLRQACRNRFKKQDPVATKIPGITFLYDCLYGPIEKVPEYIAVFPVVSAWRLERA